MKEQTLSRFGWFRPYSSYQIMVTEAIDEQNQAEQHWCCRTPKQIIWTEEFFARICFVGCFCLTWSSLIWVLLKCTFAKSCICYLFPLFFFPFLKCTLLFISFPAGHHTMKNSLSLYHMEIIEIPRNFEQVSGWPSRPSLYLYNYKVDQK